MVLSESCNRMSVSDLGGMAGGSALIGISIITPMTPSSPATTCSLLCPCFLSSTARSIFVATSASVAALAGDPEECAARDLLKGMPGVGTAKVGDHRTVYR